MSQIRGVDKIFNSADTEFVSGSGGSSSSGAAGFAGCRIRNNATQSNITDATVIFHYLRHNSKFHAFSYRRR